MSEYCHHNRVKSEKLSCDPFIECSSSFVQYYFNELGNKQGNIHVVFTVFLKVALFK